MHQLCGRYPFVVKEKFSFVGKANDIFLFQFIQFQKYFVVIIASVKNESSRFEEVNTTFNSRKGNVIDGGKVVEEELSEYKLLW